MSQPSKRFAPSKISQYLVPALLVLLMTILLLVTLVVILSLFGISP